MAVPSALLGDARRRRVRREGRGRGEGRGWAGGGAVACSELHRRIGRPAAGRGLQERKRKRAASVRASCEQGVAADVHLLLGWEVTTFLS